MALTDGNETDERISMAWRACFVALLVLLAFAVLGPRILAAFQVSMPALRIAGGLVILRVAFELMQGTRNRLTPEERQEGIAKDDVTITPLAVPVLCGPGTITTAIVVGSQAVGWMHYMVLGMIALAIYAATFALLWAAARFSTGLGQTALRVVGRLMGLVLAGVAIQFVMDGLISGFPALAG